MIEVIEDHVEINENNFAVFAPESLPTPVVEKLSKVVKRCESKIRSRKKNIEYQEQYRRKKHKSEWETKKERIDANFQCY